MEALEEFCVRYLQECNLEIAYGYPNKLPQRFHQEYLQRFFQKIFKQVLSPAGICLRSNQYVLSGFSSISYKIVGFVVGI